MSLNDIQNRIDELFTDNSSIYEIKMTSNENCFFIANDIKYVVEIIPMHIVAEIVFCYVDERGFQQATPTGLKENQFKIINTVIECVKLLVKNTDGKYDQYDFSGNIKNGLAKIYSLIGKKLKNSLEGYSFSENKSLNNYYFSITKKDDLKEQSHGGDIMSDRLNLKESTTISITNADGSSISISSDDIDELSQIMKNAGLALPIQGATDDLPIETDGDVDISGDLDVDISGDLDVIDYEDDYLNQPKDSVYDTEIPAYDLISNEDDYYFDLGDTGYDIDYEDPYGDLSSEIGYVEEMPDLNDDIIVSITCNISKSMAKSMVNWFDNYDGNINLLSVNYIPSSKIIFKIKCSDKITAEDFISDLEQIYDSNFDIEINSSLSEVAELNASVPYDEDAEESLFNIKGTAHQSDLRYVPGMAADNPMVDELRESIDSEIDDAKSYCRDDIDEAEMIHEIGLSGRAGFISSNEKDELINKLAEFFFFSYRDDINPQTELTDDNFKDIATSIFNTRLEPLLVDRGFKFE